MEHVDAKAGCEVGRRNAFGHERAVPCRECVGGGLLSGKNGREAEVRIGSESIGELFAEFAPTFNLSDCVGIVDAVVVSVCEFKPQRGRVIREVALNPLVVCLSSVCHVVITIKKHALRVVRRAFYAVKPGWAD